MSNLSLHTEPLFCSSSHLPHHSSSLFSLGGNPVIVITPPSLMKTSQAGIQLHSAKNSFFYGLHSTNSSSIQLPSNKASVIFTLPAAALSAHTRCKYKMNRTPLALSVCLSPPPPLPSFSWQCKLVINCRSGVSVSSRHKKNVQKQDGVSHLGGGGVIHNETKQWAFFTSTHTGW